MTIAIILSAHGSVSTQLLQTTEMIVGAQKNVATVELLSTENTDILTKKYNMYLSKLNTKDGILFLVDIWGGTPFNAAQKILSNYKNCDIITGMNIPMLIEIFMSRDNVKSIKQLVHCALQAGFKNIKSVKYTINSSINQEEKIPQNDSGTNLIQTNPLEHMTICLARIDDRLIHGQVVTRWAKEYTINRIIVINDEIAKDVIRKNLLTQVTPPGVTAHVISTHKAIRVYNNLKYAKDKVIMLFTNPTDVLNLIENGIPIKSINVGGMAFSQGKKQISDSISVNESDIEAFKKINQYGIELEIRKIPSDSPLQLMKLINQIN